MPLRAILFLLLWAIAAPAIAQTAEEESGFLESLIERNLSGIGRDVRISGFAGALSSRARLDQLTIADDEGVWITLSDVTLDWTRSALLRGRIEVNRLSAGKIDLARMPERSRQLSPEIAEAKPFALPDLPVSVAIGEISSEALTIGAPIFGEEISLSLQGRLSLGGGEGSTKLEVTRHDERGALKLAASFISATNVLALDLSLEEDAGGIAAKLLNLPEQPALSLRIAGEGPISDYSANIALASDGKPRVSGRVTILAEDSSEGSARRFNADLLGDLAPLLRPEFRSFFGSESTLSLSGRRMPDGALDISDLSLTAAQVKLEGALALDPAGWPTGFDLTGQIGDGKTRVRLPTAGPPTHVKSATLQARFDAARGDRWRASFNFEGLEQPGFDLAEAHLSGRGTLRRLVPRGVSALVNLELAGISIRDPALADAIGPSLSGHASVDWTENNQEKFLSLRGLQLMAGDTRLLGNGQIGTLEAGFPVAGSMTLEVPDLARYAALTKRAIAGSARGNLNGTGNLLGGQFDLKLSAQTNQLALGIPTLDPILASPGVLSLAARRDTDGTMLKHLRFESDTLRATASGQLNSKSGALSLAARLSDLALADARLTGPAEASTHFSWTDAGALSLTGLDASLMGAHVKATGTLMTNSPGLPTRGNIVADVSDLSRFSALAGRGLKGKATFDLEGDGELQSKNLSLSGTLKAESLVTGLKDLDRLTGGRLDMRAKASRTPEHIDIASLALETSHLTLSAKGNGPEAPIDLTLRLADLGLFAPDFPGPASAKGRLSLKGPEARLVSLDLSASGPGGTQTAVAGDIRDYGAVLDLSARGTAPLALFNPRIQPNTLQGTATYDLEIAGAPRLTSLSGTVQINGARVALPTQGLAVEDLSGVATLSGGRVQNVFVARMRSGGQIRITGPITLGADLNSDLAISLTNFVLSDQLFYKTIVSGDLGIKGPLVGGARITGDLSLGETEIRISSSLGPASISLPDLVHVNEPADVRLTRERAGLIRSGRAPLTRAHSLDVFISASNRIFVRGRGLDAELGGRVHLGGTTLAVAPDGFFELSRGRLDILGKRLVLTDGRVSLQGSLDPYLRFVATTETEDISASVTLEGLASAPQVTFTSEPDLPQEEVVSRLIFGQGLGNISPLRAAQLVSAIATLSGNAGNDLVSKLRGGFGLSDLDVKQNADGETEVSAGAYISDKIYTEVSVDSSGNQRINLNLDITNKLTVKGGTSSSGDSGIGVFYEKDY